MYERKRLLRVNQFFHFHEYGGIEMGKFGIYLVTGGSGHYEKRIGTRLVTREEVETAEEGSDHI